MKKINLSVLVLVGLSSMTSAIAYAQDAEIIMRRPLPNMSGEPFDPNEDPYPDGPTDPTNPNPETPVTCDGSGVIPGLQCDEDPGDTTDNPGLGWFEWVPGEWSALNPVCGEPTVMTRTVTCMELNPMGPPGSPIGPADMQPVEDSVCWAYAYQRPSTRYEGTEAGCEYEFKFIGHGEPGAPVETEEGPFHASWIMPPSCVAENLRMPIYECEKNGQPADMAYCWNDITNGGMQAGDIIDMYINEAIEGGTCQGAGWVENYDYVGCQGEQEIAILEPYCVNEEGRIVDESQCTTPHGFGPEGPVEIGTCSMTFSVAHSRQNLNSFCTGPLIGNQEDNIESGVEVREFTYLNEPVTEEIISDFCVANDATCCEYRAINMTYYDETTRIVGNIRAFRDPDATTSSFYANTSVYTSYSGADSRPISKPDDPNLRYSLPRYEEPYFPDCPAFDPNCDDGGPGEPIG